jgi:hypothetical protein
VGGVDRGTAGGIIGSDSPTRGGQAEGVGLMTLTALATEQGGKLGARPSESSVGGISQGQIYERPAVKPPGLNREGEWVGSEVR